MERTERPVVDRARAGDERALRIVVDDHVDLVHGVVSTQLGADRADEAVLDVFATVGRRIGGLSDPDRFRAWILAVCRNRIIGWPVDGSARPSAHDELRLAARGLEPRDRLLVELGVARGLAGPELALALGSAPGRSGTLAQRARRLAERSVAVRRLAKRGGADCAHLAVLVAGRRDDFDPTVRRVVARHAEDCDICELVLPPALPAAVIVPAPLPLRERAQDAAVGAHEPPEELLAGWADGWPPLAGAEVRVPVADVVDDAGTVVGRASEDEHRRRLVLVGGAAALILVALAWGIGRSGEDDPVAVGLLAADPAPVVTPTTTADDPTTTVTPPDEDREPTPSGEVGDAPPTSAPPATTSPPTSVPDTSPAPTSTVTTAPSSTPAAPPVVTATPGTTATSTTSTPPGSLLASSPPSLTLAPGDAGTVRLSNVGPETASWSASPSVGLGVSPAAGTLQAGSSVTLTVSVSSRAASGSVTVNGGASPVAIPVTVLAPAPTSTTVAPTTTTTTSTTTVTVISDDEDGSLVIDDGAVTPPTTSP